MVLERLKHKFSRKCERNYLEVLHLKQLFLKRTISFMYLLSLNEASVMLQIKL
jgi:hypothetical protein